MDGCTVKQNELSAKLHAARQHAIESGLPVRRKDGDLHLLISECLAICEMVDRENMASQLRDEIAVSIDVRGQNNAGKGRRYAERTADIPVLVARFVLEDVENRGSMYRYAACMREA